MPGFRRSVAGLEVRLADADKPVELWSISRSGFVLATPPTCVEGRTGWFRFIMSDSLSFTLPAQCISCRNPDAEGGLVSTFRFVDRDRDTHAIIDALVRAAHAEF